MPLPPLEQGQVVDGFRLEEKLHTGGMAHLWRVTRTEAAAAGTADLPLIMKVPRIKGGEDPATIVGFEVEMMILPALRGVHVPQFVARGDFTRQPYIVMERIQGPSLRPRLDHAPLALDEVIEIGSRVATALHDLHRQKLVHLDVKPSNIMFREDGTAVPSGRNMMLLGLTSRCTRCWRCRSCKAVATREPISITSSSASGASSSRPRRLTPSMRSITM